MCFFILSPSLNLCKLSILQTFSGFTVHPGLSYTWPCHGDGGGHGD